MKKKIMNILMILCLVIAIGCGVYLAYYYISNSKNEKAFLELAINSPVVNYQYEVRNDITESIASEKKDENTDSSTSQENEKNNNTLSNKNLEFIDVGGKVIWKEFQALYQKNSDIVGWIYINDTKIDYPVMHTPNDVENGQYYIHRDFSQKYSAAGVPFVDRNCDLSIPTDNTIIYGHNMNSGSMFHDLLQYENESFYQTHKTFRFDTIYGPAQYEVVAMFYGQVLDENDPSFKYYEFVNAANEEEFIDFVTQIKNMSLFDTGVEVRYGDALITLSTCAYHVKDGRFAVVARKMR